MIRKTNSERREFLKTGFFSGIYAFSASLFYTSVASTRMVWASLSGESSSKFATPTFIAFVDAVVPGVTTDPNKKPGALEAKTIDYFDAFDKAKYLPFSLGVIHFWLCAGLDVVSLFTKGKIFRYLNQAQRVWVIKRFLGISAMPLLMRLMRAPYYTGAVNRVGWDNLGYPGPTEEGYATDFSFKKQMSVAHPRSINGNLP